jgi:hypothetical protein
MSLDNFTNALLALGSTDRERADNLGIPLRTFMDYKAGRLPQKVRRFMRRDILDAMLKDVEQSSSTAA